MDDALVGKDSFNGQAAELPGYCGGRFGNQSEPNKEGRKTGKQNPVRSWIPGFLILFVRAFHWPHALAHASPFA
jgi:hypothetical protein